MGKKAAAALMAAFFMALPAQQALGAFTNNNSRAEPRTRYSGRIQSLQQEFNAQARDVTTVLLDRDWFELNLALNNEKANDKDARNQLLSDYVRDKHGIIVDPARFGVLGDASIDESGKAYVMDYKFITGADHPERERVCIAFGQNSHADAETQARSFTGLKPGTHGNLSSRKMTPPLPVEIMNAYTDLHESGHCLDDKYLLKINDSTDVKAQAAMRHRSEMYAEVLATLLLAREGHTNVALARADLRLVSAALNGPLAQHYYDPDKDLEYYSSHTYALHGALRATQGEIDKLGASALAKMTLPELRQKAFKITEASALDADQAQAMLQMTAKAYNLSDLAKKRGNSAQDEKIYQYAAQTKADMNAALGRVFDFGKPGSREPLDQIIFDFRAAAPQPQNVSQGAGALRDRLLRGAGGKAATSDTLVSSYSLLKDSLRGSLSASDVKTRASAMRDLDLMEEALRQAARRLPAAAQKFSLPLEPKPAMPRDIDLKPKIFIVTHPQMP